jgi:hypothetical protein
MIPQPGQGWVGSLSVEPTVHEIYPSGKDQAVAETAPRRISSPESATSGRPPNTDGYISQPRVVYRRFVAAQSDRKATEKRPSRDHKRLSRDHDKNSRDDRPTSTVPLVVGGTLREGVRRHHQNVQLADAARFGLVSLRWSKQSRRSMYDKHWLSNGFVGDSRRETKCAAGLANRKIRKE